MELSADDAGHSPLIARVHSSLGSALSKQVKSIEVCFALARLQLSVVCSCECAQVVFNPGRYRLFLGQLETAEKRSKEDAFQRATVRVCVTECVCSALEHGERQQNARLRVGSFAQPV